MYKVALVLAYANFSTHGQPLEISPERRMTQTQARSSTNGTFSSLRALASLVLVLKPVVAFNAIDAARAPRGTDPSIPLPGMTLPAEGAVLRGVRVIEVSQEGCLIEVDAKQGLLGFNFASALDSRHIRDVTKTFKEGDLLDVKVVGVSGITGRLLLSRKILMDEEGVRRHELPHDGREMPRSVAQGDPAIPPEGVMLPEEGAVLRGCKVVKVTSEGCYVEVDAKQNVVGWIFASLLDVGYISDVKKSFKEGDVVDVKVVGVIPISGRLMLDRRELMVDEGVKRHELPDDGREKPLRKWWTPRDPDLPEGIWETDEIMEWISDLVPLLEEQEDPERRREILLERWSSVEDYMPSYDDVLDILGHMLAETTEKIDDASKPSSDDDGQIDLDGLESWSEQFISRRYRVK